MCLNVDLIHVSGAYQYIKTYINANTFILWVCLNFEDKIFVDGEIEVVFIKFARLIIPLRATRPVEVTGGQKAMCLMINWYKVGGIKQ